MYTIPIGTIVAAYLSWITWHSYCWAVIHGLLSWIYVICWMINYGDW